MKYPMKNYNVWTQKGGKRVIDSHTKWNDVLQHLTKDILIAQPVSSLDPQSSWLILPNMDIANKVLMSNNEQYYFGRKGIESAGAKGVYVLKTPTRARDGYLNIINDMSRQRRKDILEKGEQPGIIEEKYVFPMLGGRNIDRWGLKTMNLY